MVRSKAVRAALRLGGVGATIAAAALGLAIGSASPAAAVDASPLARLAGRWVGEGRLGVRGSPTEQVKCRVTYILDGAGDRMKQTIRCASAGGKVEVRSMVTHAGGKLSGTWQELVRDWSGSLSGAVTPRGFKVRVRGETLNANMDIILLDTRQVIELQFIDSSLIGLTLVLQRG